MLAQDQSDQQNSPTAQKRVLGGNFMHVVETSEEMEQPRRLQNGLCILKKRKKAESLHLIPYTQRLLHGTKVLNKNIEVL